MSNKGDREVALQVQSDAAFALLSEMFYRDWPGQNFQALVARNFAGPAGHVLISEVLYDPTGPDSTATILSPG